MTAYDDQWRRLNPLSLLLGPVKLGKELAVPAVGVLVGVSSATNVFTGLGLTLLIGVAACVIASLPWLTTRYRITEGQLERRSGLIGRQQVTAPLDRVRSVDLEANVLHRLLGLTRVQVGTGVDDKRLELDALSVAEANELRRFLLDRSPDVSAPADTPLPPAPEEIARLDWRWIRFAPFSLTRLAVVAAILGVLSQVVNDLTQRIAEEATGAWEWAQSFPLALVLGALAVLALVAWVVIACASFVWTWAGLLVVREHGTVKITSGLVNTRAVSIEEARIRGMCLREPWLLRLVRGAELTALSTGVGKGGRTNVLPAAPLPTVIRVGAELLGVQEPLRVPLIPHGSGARRRCLIRAQRPALLLLILSSPLVVTAWWWVGLVVVPLAVGGGWWAGRAAYVHLGHHLTSDHLVAGDGVTMRRREVLETDGIIGWVVRQSFFQRRRGLATLVATTAAGGESVRVRDVPLDVAAALIGRVDPTLVSPAA